jgi:hypothetical protein
MKKMNKLSITKRGGAMIGGSMVNRTQMHGKKEKVPAISVRIAGIVLTEGEFCTVMRDPNAYEAFFTAERSAVMEARFPGISRIPIDDVFEGAKVTIEPEDTNDQVILKPAKISGVGITPVGGQPVMDCMISGAPDVHLQTLTLLNKKCRISILNGALAEKDDRQKDLPLGGDGPGESAPGDDDDEADEARGATLADALKDEDDATESAIGRQIRTSEVKKKRASRKARK